ncbi:MAG TPA: DNA translocase FtsK [Ktedonobacteraceae bacterium]|nr:DNA translocase FtsK [Ktedonobacteraceae bacterium]
MAADDQRKERKQQGRVGPSIDASRASRVSKAAGDFGSKSMRVEQRSNTPATKQRANNPVPARRSRSGKQSPKKGNRPGPPPSASTPADSRLIGNMHRRWQSLEPHHQQSIFSFLLLSLSLLLFGALTVWRTIPLFGPLAGFFLTFFGWGAYPLALGLIAFSVAHLVEGMRNIQFIRWSMVAGLLVILLLLLAESQLLLHGTPGGAIGALLVAPLAKWPALVRHVLVIGLLIIFAIVTFRITFGHMVLVAGFFKKVVSAAPGRASRGNAASPSPFLGQRPQYSRYGSNLAPSPGSPDQEDDVVDDEPGIDFEPDFGDEDDPLNDINLHKQQVGLVPRGARPAQQLDRDEHRAAVQGARQQPLPFNGSGQSANSGVEDEMEPLAPNPLQAKQPKIVTRAAKPLFESPWKLPETSILNNPEEVKLYLLGDDTTALAKIIQETLRSFRVEAEVRPEDISIGPTVIRFGIRPTGKAVQKVDEKGRQVPVKDAAGNIVYEQRTRVSRIMALQNDLALVLEAKTIRMEAPVPGRPYVGVEIPNKNSRLVTLREVLESKEYQAAKMKSKLSVALGKDVAGAVRIGDLARMPHLLIAGATGAGKCLAYDEPVFLADGRIVKVQDLVGQTVQVIGVSDIETMRQTPVSATFTENGVQQAFEIELDNGVILRRTGEHPLWAACLDENQHVGRQPDGKASRRTRAIDAGWVQAKDLRACGNRPHFDGHVILCPLELRQQGIVPKSDADVVLCAALLAEGGLNRYAYMDYNRTPRFTSADPLMVELVAKAAKEYDCKLALSQTKSKGPIDYYISRNRFKTWTGNPVAKLVHGWGMDCLATQKAIPDRVFQLPDEQVALFLRVFVDCDGWISAREQGTSSVNLTLANPILVQQIGQLALRLGITGTYLYKDNGHAGAWTWTTYMVSAWQERIGSLSKTEKLACAVTQQTRNRENAATRWTAWRQARPLADQKFADCPQGYEWRKITAIRSITVPTVNIEVHSDNHVFVGYAVEHNSVSINAIIGSILTQATPDDVRVLMVDPKMVELNMYNGIPHLLAPVVTEVDRVVGLLKIAISEMEKRYRVFSQMGVRNLEGYRKLRTERLLRGDTTLKNLPAIVIIIDELADLMMAAPEEVEGLICRLAQLARATGIHLVIATQRPSVDVITGLIKANIPTRISFMVSSAVDSRTIIDMGGAERLLGRGDMLYLPADAGKPERIQGAFVADDEADRLISYWKQQATQHAAAVAAAANAGKSPQGQGSALPPAVEPGWEVTDHSSDDYELDDELLEQAEQVVYEYERASISLLQRRLRIGYSRAARLIDLLEERGVIGRSEMGGRSREVLERRDGRYGNGGGEGRTLADEAADIIAEEKTREDFLKRQANNRQPGQGNSSPQSKDRGENP